VPQLPRLGNSVIQASHSEPTAPAARFGHPTRHTIVR
jgi:hypothetical protein